MSYEVFEGRYFRGTPKEIKRRLDEIIEKTNFSREEISALLRKYGELNPKYSNPIIKGTNLRRIPLRRVITFFGYHTLKYEVIYREVVEKKLTRVIGDIDVAIFFDELFRILVTPEFLMYAPTKVVPYTRKRLSKTKESLLKVFRELERLGKKLDSLTEILGKKHYRICKDDALLHTGWKTVERLFEFGYVGLEPSGEEIYLPVLQRKYIVKTPKFEQTSVNAVSYTHLTLPTKA